jgi:MoaA/NifB/PqqE/SkfB family radical SAM enzyme
LVSSNLSLKGHDLAEKLVESGLDSLRVSIDGITQASLEKYRRNAKLELVLENIRQIVEFKRRRKSSKPSLELVFLVFRHNEHEVPHLPALRKQLGVDSFTPRPAFIYHNSFVPQNPAYQPIQKIFQGTCHYLYSELTVEADGSISPCCTNINSRFDVGTIADLKDVHAFWNGPCFRAMRAFNAGKPRNTDDGENLCWHCAFIGHKNPEPGKLSPLPPSLVADGEQYEHGLDISPNKMPCG